MTKNNQVCAGYAEPSGISRNSKKSETVSVNVKTSFGGLDMETLDQIVDSPHKSPGVDSDLSTKRHDDPNQETFRLTDTAANKRDFGGFSIRVASLKGEQPSTSTPDHEDLSSSNKSFESSSEEQEGEGVDRISIPRSGGDSEEKAGRQRKSSLDNKSPHGLLEKPQMNIARSEQFSPDKGILIKPRSIIKTSKFASPQINLNVIPAEEKMVALGKTDKLPDSLFVDEDNKFLAVRKWKQQMLSGQESPKSAKSRHSFAKSVKFRLSTEEECIIEQKEKVKVKTHQRRERSSPISTDKTVSHGKRA